MLFLSRSRTLRRVSGPVRRRFSAGAGSTRASARSPRWAETGFCRNSRSRGFTRTSWSIRTAGDRGAPYHFEAVTEAGERFTWTGTLSADPLAFSGEFGIENLDLPKYAPFTDEASRADIT